MNTLLKMQYEKIHDDRPKISISFSGGRTSAVMTKIILDEKKNTHNIVVTFANTGCEHEGTLKFVKDCDDYWGFNTVWLESVRDAKIGVGTRHKIVDFESASRNGEPYEEAIKKHGIFNSVRPACTSYLKTEVMESYLKSIGFLRGKKINYDTAIGIRADEMDRMSIHQKKERFIYPLIDLNMTKEDVLEYMRKAPFDLNIPENMGNCVWCWKKSFRKLVDVARKNPQAFDFPRRMEKMYGQHDQVKWKSKLTSNGQMTFFRHGKSVDDIFEMAKDPNFLPVQENGFIFDEFYDKSSSCSESCEAYPTDGS
jgi:3'-phosphoadenosine 5'-phosphosulfate sulfotransferase (PAPS reductase)/FAD synthetase